MPNKILIGVGIASHPIAAAGNAWAFLQWALGFRDMGWDVWIAEEIDPAKCVDSRWQTAPLASSANLAFWREVTAAHGLSDRATLLCGQPEEELADFRQFAAECDLFLNISGHFKSKDVATPKARRIYLDLDPAFTQIWQESYGSDMNFQGHHRFFTVGGLMGQPGVLAPTCGIEWIPTFPPVFLPAWQEQAQPEFARFTTVAHWEGYKWSEWQGRWFTGKSEEFDKLVSVPASVPATMEIATDRTAFAAQLAPFEQAGWRFADAPEVCATLKAYESYIAGSSAEFSAAKGGYVTSRCGWFSDRSVCYLASGHPVVLQETGISRLVPTGCGLHTFETPEEAAAKCEAVIADRAAQRLGARRLAEDYFDSRKVVAQMLSNIA